MGDGYATKSLFFFFKSATLTPASSGLFGQRPPAGKEALLRPFAWSHILSPALSVLSLGGNMNAADSKIRHLKESW